MDLNIYKYLNPFRNRNKIMLCESPTCEYRYLLLFNVVLDDKVSDFLTTVNVSFTEIGM